MLMMRRHPVQLVSLVAVRAAVKDTVYGVNDVQSLVTHLRSTELP